jgi:hypothetical protein
MFMARVCLPPLVIGQRLSLCISLMEEARMDEATMEHATFEEQTNAEVLDATSFTLYIPDFVQEYSLSGKTLDKENTQLLRKDWLTPGLIHEIETLFPNPSEINSDDDNRCDSIAFQRKIALYFLVDGGSLPASNKLTKRQICSLEPGLSRRRCTPKASSAHILPLKIRKILESIQTQTKDASLKRC